MQIYLVYQASLGGVWGTRNVEIVIDQFICGGIIAPFLVFCTNFSSIRALVDSKMTFVREPLQMLYSRFSCDSMV